MKKQANTARSTLPPAMRVTKRSDEEVRCMKRILQKMTACVVGLVLLCTLVLPVFADGTTEPNPAPAATDWYAIQEGYDPTQTRAEFKDGRIVVNSVETEEKEPGSALLLYTQPVDLNNFEVSFSLDSYVPCADQYISVGFVNKGTELYYGPSASQDPHFCLLLRPTEWPTMIDCAQGLLVNFDTNRNVVRPGSSNFVPGFYFDTYASAPWSNVVFRVCGNGFGGYDVYINNHRINNDNDWWFINNIEDKTDSDDWYFYIKFKDGEYSPAQFTVKTLNGQMAVDSAVSGPVQNSLLAEGEEYAAVGGPLGDYVGVTKATTTTTTTTRKPTTTTTTTTVVIGGEETGRKTTVSTASTTKSTTASTTAPTTVSLTTSTTTATTTELPTSTTITTTVGSSDPSASSTTQSATASTQATQADADVDSGDASRMLWVGIGALVLVAGAGITVLLLIRRRV